VDLLVDNIDGILDQFEEHWRRNPPPTFDDIESLIPADGRRAEALAELLKIDLEYRCRQNGEMPGLPEYFQRFHSYKLSPEAILDLVVEDYRVRRRWGDHPTHQSCIMAFPEYATELPLLLLAVDQELERENNVGTHYDPQQTSSVAATLAPEAINGLQSDTVADIGSATMAGHALFLSSAEPFRDLPPNTITAIAKEMLPCEFQQGDYLLKQGDAAKRLLVVLDGRAEVLLQDDRGGNKSIDLSGSGAVFGEMSLMTGKPAAADVVALSSIRALELPLEQFRTLLQDHPPVGVAFAHLIAQRLGRGEVDVFYDKTINNFRVKRRLGRGAMGVVYEAEELGTGRRVALKMMKHRLAYDQRSVKRFHQEAEIVAQLRSPNIVDVYDSFAAYSTFFMVMELCEGASLAQLIRTRVMLPEQEIRAITGQLAAALLHAHAHEVVHRDLKPANVLLQHDGVIKLSDFGLAKSFLLQEESNLTSTGEILGTPCYMPPEQLIGSPVDHRADYYGLGCVVFELLMGKPLFRENDVMKLLQLQMQWSLDEALSEFAQFKPPVVREISSELRELLEHALAFEAADRNINLAEIASWAAPLSPGFTDLVAQR